MTGQGRAARWELAALAALVVVALTLRLVCVFQFDAHHPQADALVIDERAYDTWARELAAGDWLGDEVFFQEPLYPYALGVLYALVGPSPQAARLLQAVIGALTTLLVWVIARRAFGPAPAIVAALGWALYRPALWFPALLLKPTLFVPVLLLLCWVLLATRERDPRIQWGQRALWLAAGVLTGLGALLRGNMLVLAPLFVAWPLGRALFERRPLRPALASGALVLAGVVLVLLPVVLRNRAVGGRFVLTTTGAGTNFYGGNNRDNPYGLATEFDWVRGIPEHEPDDWRHEAERRLGRALDARETSSYWLGQALTSMRADPGLHARIFWRKLRLTLGAYEVPDNHFLEWDARYVPVLRLGRLGGGEPHSGLHVGSELANVLRAPFAGFSVWGMTGLAGLVLALCLSRRTAAPVVGPAAAREVALVFALYLATIVLTVTSERVRFALVPLLLPFAGYALFALWSGYGSRRWILPLATLVVSSVIVSAPVLPAEQRERDFYERDYNLAVGLVARERLDEAQALAHDLDARYPGSVRLATLQADLDWRRGRRKIDAAGASPEAREAGRLLLESALDRLQAVRPKARPQEAFAIHLLAGAIQQYLGQWESAARHYRAARGFDPEDPDLCRRLAVAAANTAMLHKPGPEREKGLREAEALLADLVADGADTDVQELLARIRAEL